MEHDPHAIHLKGMVVILKLSIEEPRTLDGFAPDVELASLAPPLMPNVASVLKNALVGDQERLDRCSGVRLIWWMVETGGRRAATCASFFGLRFPKVSSRLTFWPEAISNASMFTFWSLLKRNPLIPCQSLASANKGSTHTLRLRSAFS